MIYKYDFRYSVAKFFVDTALRLNFRKLIITGKENIPDNLPVIFTPNHRNALIDALLLVYANKQSRQVVFLARGDIFKKPLIAWLLRGMRLIPVFRIRDGKDKLSKNGEIFNIAGNVLKNKNPIALFPEATHNPKQSLLPLQKAVPRIVLPTEAQQNFELNSQIIPVSIYYRNLYEFLTDCYVHFGKPISVKDYRDIYSENPNLAINQLRSDLELQMRKMVVDISNDAHYQLYKDYLDWNIDSITSTTYKGIKDSTVRAAHEIVGKLDKLFRAFPDAFEQKIADHQTATEIAMKHKLRSTDHLLKPKSTVRIILSLLLLLLTSPLALFGFLNGIFPIIIYKRLLRLFKDRQFTATVRYVTGLFFIPIFDLIQTLIVKWVSHSWQLAIAYFIAMPLSFLFAIHWRRKAKSINRRWRVNRFAKNFSEEWEKLTNLIRL